MILHLQVLTEPPRQPVETATTSRLQPLRTKPGYPVSRAAGVEDALQVGASCSHPMLQPSVSLPRLCRVAVFLIETNDSLSSTLSKQVAYRAQLGRLGGYRWGWVL